MNTLSISNSLAGSFYSKRPWMCHLTVCPLGAFFFFSALSFSSISMFSFSIREMRVLQRLWSSCNTKQPRDPWARPHKKQTNGTVHHFLISDPIFFTIPPDPRPVLGWVTQYRDDSCQLLTQYRDELTTDSYQLPLTEWGQGKKKTESEFLVLISYCQFPVSTIWRALYHILSFFSLSTAMVEGTVDHGFENLFRTSENWGQDLWAEKHWSRPHTNSCLQLTGCSQRPFNARPQCSCMATQLVFYMHFYIHKGRVVRVVQICLTAAIAPTY